MTASAGLLSSSLLIALGVGIVQLATKPDPVRERAGRQKQADDPMEAIGRASRVSRGSELSFRSKLTDSMRNLIGARRQIDRIEDPELRQTTRQKYEEALRSLEERARQERDISRYTSDRDEHADNKVYESVRKLTADGLSAGSNGPPNGPPNGLSDLEVEKHLARIDTQHRMMRSPAAEGDLAGAEAVTQFETDRQSVRSAARRVQLDTASREDRESIARVRNLESRQDELMGRIRKDRDEQSRNRSAMQKNGMDTDAIEQLDSYYSETLKLKERELKETRVKLEKAKSRVREMESSRELSELEKIQLEERKIDDDTRAKLRELNRLENEVVPNLEEREKQMLQATTESEQKFQNLSESFEKQQKELTEQKEKIDQLEQDLATAKGDVDTAQRQLREAEKMKQAHKTAQMKTQETAAQNQEKYQDKITSLETLLNLEKQKNEATQQELAQQQAQQELAQQEVQQAQQKVQETQRKAQEEVTRAQEEAQKEAQKKVTRAQEAAQEEAQEAQQAVTLAQEEAQEAVTQARSEERQAVTRAQEEAQQALARLQAQQAMTDQQAQQALAHLQAQQVQIQVHQALQAQVAMFLPPQEAQALRAQVLQLAESLPRQEAQVLQEALDQFLPPQETDGNNMVD